MTVVRKRRKKKIIGRREAIDFPELDLFGVEAKIDTGAYTSSLHCKDVKHTVEADGEFVSFLTLDASHPQFDNKAVKWPLHKVKQVKNSFGQTEERFIIETRIQIFDEDYPIEVSLADRSEMDYPVLLGRKALKKRFLVDVSKTNCSLKKKLKDRR